MARVLRGFPAQGVVACFTEPNTTGDPLDFNAPRNAPAKTPMSHLSRIAFHSDLTGYELAMPIQTVTINHPVYPTVTTVFDAASDFLLGWLTHTQLGRPYRFTHTLVTHNLGYVPLAMVAYEDRVVVSGTIVQSATSMRRFVSAYATSSIIGLVEVGMSSDVALPAVSRNYKVMVFRAPTADPDLPLFSGDADSFQAGRGKINSEAMYARRARAGDTPFDFDLDRTIDIKNGAARIATGGNIQSDPLYDGTFTGGAYIPVGGPE